MPARRRWNRTGSGPHGSTQATGSSAGSGTDYTGANQSIIPNISIAADAITDAASNGIAVVSSSTVTTDGASPVLIGQKYTSSVVSAVDGIELTFSEDITTNSAVIGDFAYTPGDITNSALAGGGGSYLAETAQATVTFTLHNAGDPDLTSHSTAPTLTYTAGGAINDGTNAVASFGPVNLSDGAGPSVVSATLDYNDDVSELVVTFSEAVEAESTDESKFHINNTTGMPNDVAISTATASGDGVTQTFVLTAAERIAALAISGEAGGDGGAVVLDVDTGAVTDAASNAQVDDDETVIQVAAHDVADEMLKRYKERFGK